MLKWEFVFMGLLHQGYLNHQHHQQKVNPNEIINQINNFYYFNEFIEKFNFYIIFKTECIRYNSYFFVFFLTNYILDSTVNVRWSLQILKKNNHDEFHCLQ